MPFHLGWLALYERGRLQRDETLLVHGGAGGAGSAAIQLGVHVGAHVIATAGSDVKLALCRDLGADLAIDHRDGDVAEQVLAATDGRGVDVAFDTIGGATTLETFRCMAFNGRHLLAGFASGIAAEDEGIVPRPVLFGNFSLVGVCHAYVDDPVTFKQLTGFNFAVAPRRRGAARAAVRAVRARRAAHRRRCRPPVLGPAPGPRGDGAARHRRPGRGPHRRLSRSASVGSRSPWLRRHDDTGPAVEGWFTMDDDARAARPSRGTETGSYFFPKNLAFSRNPAAPDRGARGGRALAAGPGVVVDDEPLPAARAVRVARSVRAVHGARGRAR